MLKGSNGIYLNSKSKPETKSLEEKNYVSVLLINNYNNSYGVLLHHHIK
jgi:hypothetical protein